MQRRNLYEILELKKFPTPSQQDIRKAYLNLALKYHPDKNATQVGDKAMQEINHAYDILGDPEKRILYDRYDQSEEVSAGYSSAENNLAQKRLLKLNNLISQFKTKYQNTKTQIFSEAQSFNSFLFRLNQLSKDLAHTFKEQPNDELSRQINSLFHNTADFFLIEDAAEMLQKIINDDNPTPSRCKQYIVEFGFKFREQSDARRFLGFFWGSQSVVEWLLDESIGLSLNELELNALDEQIQRINGLQIDVERISEHKTFVASLITLRKEISSHIRAKDKGEVWAWESKYSRRFPSKTEVSNSEAIIAAKKTTALLENLTFDSQRKEKEYNDFVTYGIDYEKTCKDNPKTTNFLKGVGTVILSGIGFVAGVAAGAVAGVLAGVAAGGLGILLTVPYFTFKGAVKGAKFGRDVGKKIFNTPYDDSVARHLLFKPPYIAKAGNKVAINGMKCVEPHRADHHEVDIEKIVGERMKLIPSY